MVTWRRGTRVGLDGAYVLNLRRPTCISARKACRAACIYTAYILYQRIATLTARTNRLFLENIAEISTTSIAVNTQTAKVPPVTRSVSWWSSRALLNRQFRDSSDVPYASNDACQSEGMSRSESTHALAGAARSLRKWQRCCLWCLI